MLYYIDLEDTGPAIAVDDDLLREIVSDNTTSPGVAFWRAPKVVKVGSGVNREVTNVTNHGPLRVALMRRGARTSCVRGIVHASPSAALVGAHERLRARWAALRSLSVPTKTIRGELSTDPDYRDFRWQDGWVL